MHWQAVSKAVACSGITFTTVSGLPVPEQATTTGLSALTWFPPGYLSLILHLCPTYHSCLFCPHCIIQMQSKAFLRCRVFKFREVNLLQYYPGNSS